MQATPQAMNLHEAWRAIRARIEKNAKGEFEHPIILKPWRNWNAQETQRKITQYQAECSGGLVQINNALKITNGVLTPKETRENLSRSTHSFLKRVVRLVAEGEGVTSTDIFSPRRDRRIVYARFMCVHLALTMTDWSLVRIGRFLGGKDHTTILAARRRILEMIAGDASIRGRVETYRAELQKYAPSLDVNNSQGELTGEWYLSTQIAVSDVLNHAAPALS